MPQYFKIEASCYYAAQSLLRDYLYLCGFERELDDFFCRLEPVAVRNDMIVIKTLGCCITKVLRFRTRRKKFPPKKKIRKMSKHSQLFLGKDSRRRPGFIYANS